MKRWMVLLVGVSGALPIACGAQNAQSMPDAPKPAAQVPARAVYDPPTQGERLKEYLRSTYGVMSLVEAGAHAGIAQARDNPSQWPQGAEGYGDRFGSAFGEIAVRQSTEFVVADLFREDLRRARCTQPCSESVFRLAFEDTFLARKGADGHEAFSVARMVGPFSGAAVATNVWYPTGAGRGNTAKEAGLQFGLVYMRHLVREAIARR
ncbi:MAG TPA: hypothetical protein VMA34_08040 [Terracidiphilus sp.]|nr:hypothetical protein [Terracidiphilus sp.]